MSNVEDRTQQILKDAHESIRTLVREDPSPSAQRAVVYDALDALNILRETFERDLAEQRAEESVMWARA